MSTITVKTSSRSYGLDYIGTNPSLLIFKPTDRREILYRVFLLLNNHDIGAISIGIEPDADVLMSGILIRKVELEFAYSKSFKSHILLSRIDKRFMNFLRKNLEDNKRTF